MKQLQKFYPHILSVLGFIFIALIYFYPVLQGKKIYQSDIVQYTAMAKEQNDFRASENAEPYWTNSAFGGMPTYQLGAKYPNDFIGDLDDALRFLPRPADYLFLYFFGFYTLLLILKIDPLKAFFGALAFGFSTYFIVIFGAGHNAKAHAIAYFPLVIGGILLVFRKKYIVGGLLTLIAVALELNANHFQMTYYLLLVVISIGVYYSYKLFKNKDYNSIGKIVATFAVALLLAIGLNATNLLATKEYAAFSTRSKSDLKLDEKGQKKTDNSALSREYITEYSYGIAESLNTIAPRLFGGASGESLGKDSEIVAYLQQQQVGEGEFISEEKAIEYAADGMPTYWGDQTSVAGPAYIGAIVFFLAVLCLYHDKRKFKYIFVAGAIASLLLSWGKNFSILTDFFIDYVPMYDKFRAVSSIQVILEFCVPVLAILGFQSFFANKENQLKSLKYTVYTTFGIIIALFLCKSMFSFSGANDGNYIKMYGPEFMNALKADRKTLYSADLLRSGFFMLVAATSLWFYIKNTFSANTAVIIIGLFMVTDLVLVDKKYVSSKDFVAARQVDEPFEPTTADLQILQDKSIYRVLEVDGNLNSSRASNFHKSIGGYHAAKPKRIQELFDYQIANNNKEIIDMLNVKYIIQSDEKEEQVASKNPDANGNAWFVKELKTVKNADEEMKALTSLDTKNVAVTQEEISSKFKLSKQYSKDSLTTIKLTNYKPNDLKYVSNNKNEGVAVFSEMYYKEGWNAYIDGKLTDHFKVNYALRALKIPSGSHKIEFKFEPQVIKTGSMISLISSFLVLGLIGFGIYFERKKSMTKKV
ncbi:YfhO family protein [Flavobacterium sp.]|uniref:YfhO family protein n=1 Tax=Flavobacterium sp. TaxID=239 RepID=UPI00375316F7